MKEERIIYLDAVRGIAALLVVMHHYLMTFYPLFVEFNPSLSRTANETELSIGLTPANILFNGTFAVCVFFVLSGYVLSLKFFRDNDIEGTRSGAFKRYFRLVIPVFFSAFLSYLLFLSKAYYNFDEISNPINVRYYSKIWQLPSDFYSVLYDSFFKTMFLRQVSPYNLVLWTMSIEFLGSMMVFSFLALLGHLKNRWLLYLIFILLFHDSYFLSFFLGIMLCDYYNSAYKFKVSWTFNLIVALIALYISSYQEYSMQSIWSILNGLFTANKQTLLIIGAFLFLFVVLNSPWLKNVFSKKGFRYLGKISFSIYLVHLLVLCSLSDHLFDFFTKKMNWSYHLSFLAMFSISLLAIWGIAHLFCKLVDENAIRFSNYLYKKFFRQKIASVSVEK